MGFQVVFSGVSNKDGIVAAQGIVAVVRCNEIAMDVELQQFGVVFHLSFVLITRFSNNLQRCELGQKCNVWLVAVPRFKWCDGAAGWYPVIILNGDDMNGLP